MRRVENGTRSSAKRELKAHKGRRGARSGDNSRAKSRTYSCVRRALGEYIVRRRETGEHRENGRGAKKEKRAVTGNEDEAHEAFDIDEVMRESRPGNSERSRPKHKEGRLWDKLIAHKQPRRPGLLAAPAAPDQMTRHAEAIARYSVVVEKQHELTQRLRRDVRPGLRRENSCLFPVVMCGPQRRTLLAVFVGRLKVCMHFSQAPHYEEFMTHFR
ncbi:hypothetical protein MRX96_003706 [Rhipicephalus microplus]